MEIDVSSDVNIDDVNFEIPIDEQENITKIHRDECDCSTFQTLKKELQLRETQIMKLTSHIHMLETDPPSQSKKRRLGEIDKEDMNETMMKDKDIIISNLTKEIEMLKADASKAKVDGETYKNDLESLKKDAQDKERQASDPQQKNEHLSLREIVT